MTQSEADPSQSSLIELQVDRLRYLFDPFDPFPTPTRDLSRGAEEFIVGWARDLPQRSPIRLRLHLAHEDGQAADKASLKAAISRHFAYKAERVSGDLRELIEIGRWALTIGLCVLGVCILLRQLLLSVLPQGAFSGILAEGLVIVGWVANWRPIEIFLYEWWPMLRKRRLFRRLATAEVEIVPLTGASPNGIRRDIA
jgi:hypothetical protein